MAGQTNLMILIDTSAWIEFDRATESPADLKLATHLEAGATVAATEPVLMELLAGARSETDAARLRRLMLSNEWLPVSLSDYESAASIYRQCRYAGLEPGGTVDCLIAAVALRADAAILAADRHFGDIAQVVPLQLDL